MLEAWCEQLRSSVTTMPWESLLHPDSRIEILIILPHNQSDEVHQSERRWRGTVVGDPLGAGMKGSRHESASGFEVQRQT